MATNGSGDAKDGSPSGLLRFEVDVNDVTTDGIFSPEIKVLGLPWRLLLKKKGDETPVLGAYLRHRESDSNIWSFNVSAEFSVLGSNPVKMSYNKVFSHEIVSWGFHVLISWEDLINVEKGFVNDGKIIVEVKFTLSNVTGLSTIPQIDFTDENDPCHDVALVINGQKLFVSKQILAVHSPFFKAMFFGNFDEKDKKEVELREVNREEFVEVLRLIYPCSHEIKDSNAEFVLKIADQYQMQTIIDQVEKFLINSTSLKQSIPYKLRLSDQYRLVKLQDHCLESFQTVKEIMALKTNDDFKALSNTAKATLLLKAMKLS